MVLISVIDIDLQLFHFINGEMANPVFDVVLKWIRHPLFWMPFYVFVVSFLFYNMPRNKVWVLLGFLVMNVCATDIVSSRLVKNYVKRVRPCNDLSVKNDVKLLVPCGRGYSFTSSHATNHFGIATFLFLTLGCRTRWLRWPLIIWASAICLAQVYVGVHYPLDVFAGAMLGVLIARLMFSVFKRFERTQRGV